MIIKKVLIVLTLFITVFTLSACDGKNTEPEVYNLTVTSNIEGADPTFSENLNDRIDGYRVYSFSTGYVEGYTLEYWHLVGSDEQLSTDHSFLYVPKSDVTLEAYYSSDVVVNDDYTVIVTSNVESIVVTVNETTTGEETEYELTAPIHDDFTFLYWIDLDTEAVLSTDIVFSFVASIDQSIEAIYELNELPEPVLFYETEFNDASKGAYAEGFITTGGKELKLSDALVGSLATDLKISGNSVRIRDGYVKTMFSVTDLAHVMFYVGTYGSDDDTTVNLQLSLDQTTWTTVDSFVTTNTLELYSYIFDDTILSGLGIDTSNAYYLRIESVTGESTNIDDLKIYTGFGFVADDTPLYTITFSDMSNQYLLDETVDLTGCVATHQISGATTCDITGTVDSSVAGVYEVIFSKTDEYGNTAVEIVRITVIDPVNVDINMDMDTYYDNAEGLYGDALIEALNIKLNNGFSGVTYGEARYILDESDMDPNNSNNIILVYLRTSISGIWDSGETWNREHVWPQSLLGESADNGTVNIASDLFNLMPSNSGENSSRGNQPYSAIVSGYEPHDDVKGDVARALFYMMIMYEELELVNTAPGLYEMGYLDELLEWHYSDPVSEFELNRLEVIYGNQNNRNPFVDYPHLVDLIWYYEGTE
jgi:endonuclease I